MLGFVRPLLPVGVACALIMVQPDFGTTAVVLATVMGLLFLGGVSVFSFARCLRPLRSPLAALIIVEPYRMQRVASFLGSVRRPLQLRLSAQPGADRPRPRRVVRGRPRQRHSEAVLLAGGAHRFPARRGRRGVRPARRAAGDRPVCLRDLARLRHRRRARARANAVRLLRGPRLRAAARACRPSSMSASTPVCCRPRAAAAVHELRQQRADRRRHGVAVLLRIDFELRRRRSSRSPRAASTVNGRFRRAVHGERGGRERGATWR
jgi:hypothetical protein